MKIVKTQTIFIKQIINVTKWKTNDKCTPFLLRVQHKHISKHKLKQQFFQSQKHKHKQNHTQKKNHKQKQKHKHKHKHRHKDNQKQIISISIRINICF